jgi:hypothetical protein
LVKNLYFNYTHKKLHSVKSAKFLCEIS